MRTIALVVSVMVFWATAAFAELEGFVVEAVLASPEADSPLDSDTVIEIAEGGYIVIIARSGALVRKDGPFRGPASSLLNAAISPGDDDLGNPVLSSLLELAEVSRASEETIGGVRGAMAGADVHLTAITSATKKFCLVAGATPEFYVSRSPARDEPVTFRNRVSPEGFLQAKWPVGAHILPWPENWPVPVEGRFIWTLGDRGPTPLWIRVIESLPDNPPERAAFLFDLRCTTQAVALIRMLIESATRR